MTEPSTSVAAHNADKGHPDSALRPFPIHRSWKIASIVASVMVLLALLGVGITTVSPSAAYGYWVSLVPIYGILCVATANARFRGTAGYGREQVLRQLWHWLGIGIAVGMDFFIRSSGQEDPLLVGFNALLLLAVGCYLAGVHLEWHFTVVGGLLTLALIIVVKANQYIWLMVVIGIVAVLVMLALNRLLAPKAESKAQPVQASGPVPPTPQSPAGH